VGNINNGSVCSFDILGVNVPVLARSLNTGGLLFADASFRSCINIGCPSRTLATMDPPLDSTLPVDDAIWEQAVRYELKGKSRTLY
jgi:hypothetical protein